MWFNTFPDPHDLITQGILQFGEVLCFADRIGHDNVDLGGFEGVCDVVRTGCGERDSRRDVGFGLVWESGAVVFSLSGHCVCVSL